jgi:hypothetical protein
VRRPNQTMAKFHVTAVLKAGRLTELPVDKVEEMSSGPRPSKEEAAKLFADAWTHARPEFKVNSVEVLGEEFHQYKDRLWMTYKLAVHVTGTKAGKKYKCEPQDFNSELKLDPAKKAWAANEQMIKNINEAAYCEEE